MGNVLCMPHLLCIACCFFLLYPVFGDMHQDTALSVWRLWVQTVVVDARAHMLGRLASIVAKQLLNGQHVVSFTNQYAVARPVKLLYTSC